MNDAQFTFIFQLGAMPLGFVSKSVVISAIIFASVHFGSNPNKVSAQHTFFDGVHVRALAGNLNRCARSVSMRIWGPTTCTVHMGATWWGANCKFRHQSPHKIQTDHNIHAFML